MTATGTQASYDFAGAMSGGPFAGVPKTHITLAATYTEGPWTGTVQTRYIGAAQLVNGWTSGVQIDNNNVAQVAYLDLRGTYRWNDNIQFYLSVDNVFDTPAPGHGGSAPATTASRRPARPSTTFWAACGTRASASISEFSSRRAIQPLCGPGTSLSPRASLLAGSFFEHFRREPAGWIGRREGDNLA